MIRNITAVTFDVREISGRQAGIGRIITSLIRDMQSVDPKREFVFIGSSVVSPEALNGTYKNIGSSGLFWHIKCARMLKKTPQWGTYVSVRSPLVPIMVPERSVYFVNDLISFKYPEYFTYKTRIIESLFVKLALKRVKNIVAISQSTARDIEALCPGAKARTTVVPLAADPIFGKRQPDIKLLNRYGIYKPYLLSVGTVEPRKNHLSLVKAYQGLPKALRDKYDLVLVGKKGWRCGHIIQTIDEGVRSGFVKYLEFIPDADLVHIYNGSSLFVYPSFYEGFGLPVVEAMRCGVPVITSNRSSLPETGGKAAYYIDPHKPEEISDAMIKILTDQTQANKMSALGLTQSSDFSWNKVAKAIYDIIDNS